jgi:MFS-type transporter involved in bile tolerance (Atg22 family)
VLTGRFAAILGPLVWGLVVWAGEPLGPLRYRLAVGAMLVFMLAGLYAFRFIPEPAPETPENALS